MVKNDTLVDPSSLFSSTPRESEKEHHLVKSNSSENLFDNESSLESNHEDNFLEEWKRTAKIRRSLQLSKNRIDIPIENGNVNKLVQEVEKGRRLNSAIRNTNVDLEALDQILKSISPMISTNNKPDCDNRHTGGYLKDPTKLNRTSSSSFITAASLQEVRGKLRRLSSPANVYKDMPKIEIEPDDGIVAEDMDVSRVKSFVYGMENNGIRKTGSLETRNYNRNEDW